MDISLDLAAKLAAPVLSAVVGTVLKSYTEGRSKLISFVGHVSAFVLKDENRTTVHTHSIVVRNSGTKAARDVRLMHEVLPPNITVHPSVQYKIEQNPDGGGDIVFPILVPKEQVTVSYLYFPPLLWSHINANVKSEEGFGRVLNVIPTPQPSKVALIGLGALIFLGASTIFYWAILLLLEPTHG
jgi:hypothetical protein